ncbi:purine-nucleoside phosphorylase [Peptoniphilus catoniae]|uniref:purine-nucleoside phosphorylase n=1 Tax=Peptoniphilus catoniae TaxID=1660341 RepID=UPI003D15FCDA
MGVILGSGLGDFADLIENPISFDYKNIPGFVSSSVVGHDSKLIMGKLEGKSIVVMKGRVHYYEGLGMDKVIFPIKVLSELGVEKLIVTNASGAVNKSFKPKDIMIIKDHINITGINPLIGPNDEKGPRFPDMTYTYSRNLIKKAKEAAKNINLDVKEGVYMWFSGPSYETPAEVRAAGILGADSVGMSTVPEVIIAKHRNMEVLGLSCTSNMAAGVLDQPLNHEDVINSSKETSEIFKKYVRNIIKVI